MLEFLRQIGVSGDPGAGLVPVVLLFVVAAAVTWVFIPRLRAFAIDKGLGDKPNARRLNTELLPNLGGLAIYFGVIAALVLAIALKGSILKTVQVQVLAIVLGGTVMLLVGFIDDQFDLPPSFRFVIQGLAAGLLIVNGIRIDLPFLNTWGDVALTVFWVIGIVNAVNFMDGIDGLVGGLGFISSVCLLALSAQYPNRAAATLILAALAGGALGFLRHNYNPSRIILGDAGATFIGFTLAAVSMLGVTKVAAAASLVAPLLFLAVPIVDTTQVVIRRLRKKQSPFMADKRHLHHLLLKTGLNQRSSVAILWGAILLVNILGMVLQHAKPLVIALTAAGVVLALVFVARVRLGEIRREALKNEALQNQAQQQEAQQRQAATQQPERQP